MTTESSVFGLFLKSASSAVSGFVITDTLESDVTSPERVMVSSTSSPSVTSYFSFFMFSTVPVVVKNRENHIIMDGWAGLVLVEFGTGTYIIRFKTPQNCEKIKSRNSL